MPFLVRERLFIGAINDAAEILQKGSTDITYILSVLSSASISFFSDWRSNILIQSKEIRRVFMSDNISRIPDKEIDSSVNRNSSQKLLYSLEMAGPELNLARMAVPLRDTENENLLDYLDVCLDFIDNSRKEGSVLVHCFAGVSRSAAVITAYLMRTEELSQEAALESLRMSCDFVCPNDGFLEQLKMFEEMGFKVDTSSSIYKRFRLKKMGDLYNRGEMIDTSTFGSDPGLPSEPILYESIIASEMPKHVYRCKKCRRIVAIQDNVFEHVPGEGEKSFDWRKRKSGHPFDRSDEFPCSSIFIEPLQWMTSVKDGALEGKLSCIHCEVRLGNFNWSGIQCSCGSWITPAFQLHKSRVDISTS